VSEYIGVREAAKLKDKSPETLRDYLRRGKLQGINIDGKLWRVPLSELERLWPSEGDGTEV